jgi:hypothetical protein
MGVGRAQGFVGLRRRIFFCYIDARDLRQILDRCLKVDGLGYQVFNAGNDENGMNLDNAELLARFFPCVPVTRALSPHAGPRGFSALVGSSRFRCAPCVAAA